MTEPRLRALILTAGLGRRLRPLTDECPKALLPVLGRRLVELILDRLIATGCEAVALNLHHLGNRIEAALGESYGPMRLVYSHEPQLLGTLGALVPLREFLLAADYVFVINGDSLCEWPLQEMLEDHLRRGAQSTLLVSEAADLEDFGCIGVDASGRVVAVPGAVKQAVGSIDRVFAGAQVFSPGLIEGRQPGVAGIWHELYAPLLDRGSYVQAYRTRCPWYDLGTPRRYLEAVCHWQPGSRSWVSPGARVSSSAEIRSSVIESGAQVGRNARSQGCLLMAGSELGEGASIADVILAPGARLPPRARIVERMITVPRRGQSQNEAGAVAAELVYTPLDGSGASA